MLRISAPGRAWPLVLSLFLPRLAFAQTDTSPRPPGTRISGNVYDSLARAPLARATVQIVAADDPSRFALSTEADSLGRYIFSDVPAGKYRLGFFHEMLDSLGIDPPLVDAAVDGTRPTLADIGMPSATRIRAAT